jgi:hypothetical protein
MALGQIGDERAIEPLLNVCIYDKLEKQAKNALLNIGKPAVRFLIRKLKKEPSSVLISILGKLGDKNALDPLLRIMKKDYYQLGTRAQNAAEAVENLGWSPSNDETGAIYWILKKKYSNCLEIGTPAVRPLVNWLESKPDKDVIEILGRLADKSAVKPLAILALDQGKKKLGISAVKALEDLCGKASIPISGLVKSKIHLFTNAKIKLDKEPEVDSYELYMDDDSPGHANYREYINKISQTYKKKETAEADLIKTLMNFYLIAGMSAVKPHLEYLQIKSPDTVKKIQDKLKMGKGKSSN